MDDIPFLSISLVKIQIYIKEISVPFIFVKQQIGYVLNKLRVLMY